MANVSADTRKVAPLWEMHSQSEPIDKLQVRIMPGTYWKIRVCDRGRLRPRSSPAASSITVWTSVNMRDASWPVRNRRSNDKTLLRLEIGRIAKKKRENALLRTPP